jgi:hypothetical protein
VLSKKNAPKPNPTPFLDKKGKFEKLHSYAKVAVMQMNAALKPTKPLALVMPWNRKQERQTGNER